VVGTGTPSVLIRKVGRSPRSGLVGVLVGAAGAAARRTLVCGEVDEPGACREVDVRRRDHVGRRVHRVCRNDQVMDRNAANPDSRTSA